MTGTNRFTATVRQELASLPLTSMVAVQAEAAAIIHLRASVDAARTQDGRIAPNGGQIALETTCGATARRTHALLSHLLGWPPQLMVRSGAGAHGRSRFRISCEGNRVSRQKLWISEQPLPVVQPEIVAGNLERLSDQARLGWLRGVVLAAGVLSSPSRQAHLEIRVEQAWLAETVASQLAHAIGTRPSMQDRNDRGFTRIVMKSGEAIGDVLVAVGASNAFLAWDEKRLRRQLRSEANRLANADTANVARTLSAAERQIRKITEVVELYGWEMLDDTDRSVALARVANPTASLAELGDLLDPPMSKATVARRLHRVSHMADHTSPQR